MAMILLLVLLASPAIQTTYSLCVGGHNAYLTDSTIQNSKNELSTGKWLMFDLPRSQLGIHFTICFATTSESGWRLNDVDIWMEPECWRGIETVVIHGGIDRNYLVEIQIRVGECSRYCSYNETSAVSIATLGYNQLPYDGMMEQSCKTSNVSFATYNIHKTIFDLNPTVAVLTIVTFMFCLFQCVYCLYKSSVSTPSVNSKLKLYSYESDVSEDDGVDDDDPLADIPWDVLPWFSMKHQIDPTPTNVDSVSTNEDSVSINVTHV